MTSRLHQAMLLLPLLVHAILNALVTAQAATDPPSDDYTW